MKKPVILLLSLFSVCSSAFADQCQLVDGRSITIDQAGNVTAPADLEGWRLSDKDDASGLEIYRRGSSPREALDVSTCTSGEAGAEARKPSFQFVLAKTPPARELGTCFCECDRPEGEIVETGREFEGPDQREQCEATCQAQVPGSKSVCAR